MSNWITDNKPAAMVAGVGLLLFLGLSATGYIVNSKRSELDKKISIAAKEIKSANAAEITPSRSSNEELEKELNRYAKAVGSLETAYKPFLASSALVPTTPTAFQNELKTFRFPDLLLQEKEHSHNGHILLARLPDLQHPGSLCSGGLHAGF